MGKEKERQKPFLLPNFVLRNRYIGGFVAKHSFLTVPERVELIYRIDL